MSDTDTQELHTAAEQPAMPPPAPKEWKVGMVEGESSDHYHECPAISSTNLEDFRARPRYFYEKHVAETIVEKKGAALTNGAAFHCAVLEGPDAFKREYVVVPADAPRRPTRIQREAKKPSDETVAAIAWWDKWTEENKGRVEIDKPDYDRFLAMANAVADNAVAAEVLTAPGCKCEVTFRTPKIPAFGFALQAKLDLYNPQGCEFSAGLPYMVDIKTIDDLARFQYHFEDFGYYRRTPFYSQVIATAAAVDSRIVKPQRSFYVVIESGAPYGCTVFEADPLSTRRGLWENERDLKALAECFRSGVWPNGATYANVGLSARTIRNLEAEGWLK